MKLQPSSHSVFSCFASHTAATGRRLTACTLAALLFTVLSSCQTITQPRDHAERDDRLVVHEPDATVEKSAAVAATAPSDNTRFSTIDAELPWVHSIQPMFVHARKLVENELNIDLKHVRLLLVDDQPINAEVANETRRLVNAQFGRSHFADTFLSKVMKAQSGTYAALFSARLDAVMVSRDMLRNYELSLPEDPQLRAAALLTLLIHELVHAADDKRYHIHEKRALNFRASFAQSATFEGHAQWVTRQICATRQCTIGLEALDEFMFSRTTQAASHTQPVEAISRNVLEYSYVEGERFITQLAKRENGAQLIHNLLTSPPYDPIQILAPESYPDVARETRNQRLIRASRNISHPWAGGSWIGVETSPLKGVNLRADPTKRRAAVDGFTRLIHGMVAVQLYDRSSPSRNPLEVTLLQAESAHTARLFAQTLHRNTQHHGTQSNDEPLRIRTGSGLAKSEMQAHAYRTSMDSDAVYRTAIVVSGPYVVQVAGNEDHSDPLDDYAIRVLLNLQLDD